MRRKVANPSCNCGLGGDECSYCRIGELTMALQQCWFWFDDHDDRMTSAELHALIKKTLGQDVTP